VAASEIRVPDLGEFKDVLVIDVMVKAGDSIEPESSLVTLETDKATMDVPSPLAGTVATVHVAKGDKVSTGTLLVTMAATADVPAETGERDAAAAATAAEDAKPEEPKAAQAAAGTKPALEAAGAAAQAPIPEPAGAASDANASPPTSTPASTEATASAVQVPASTEATASTAHAGPSVRAFARELGVDLAKVTGSGRKGRVTADDVKAFVKALLTAGAASPAAAVGLPRVPDVDFAKYGPVEVVPLTRIQRISGPRLHASWVNIPHVTQFEDADVTDLEEARKWLKLRAAAEGIALTSLAFVLRACVLGLQRFPRLGASPSGDGKSLVLKKYCHIGFAADTPDGLVVPVIRDADRMSVFDLARALGELSAKARTGKLGAADMQGGCFTVSNLGGIGGTAFTPIINAPEVAVLGVSRAAQRPVWKDGAFVPRLILPLSLSYDHRVVDGADGARFTGFLAGALADVPALMAALP